MFFSQTFNQILAQVETAGAGETRIDLIDMLEKGGIMMIPLAGLSLIAVFMIFFSLITIRRNKVVSDRFMSTAETFVRKGDTVGLLDYCQRSEQSISYITEKTIDFMNAMPAASFAEVREVAEAEGSRQAGILNRRISYLADIGAIAPMVGLLGTVFGMIKSFSEISQGFEGVRQVQLASGVSEALITTAAGLLVGITAVAFYSLFRGRVQRYVSELEAAATHLMALLSSQYHRKSKQSQPPPLEPTAKKFPEIDTDVPDLQGI